MGRVVSAQSPTTDSLRASDDLLARVLRRPKRAGRADFGKRSKGRSVSTGLRQLRYEFSVAR